MSALVSFFGAQLLNIAFGAGFAWHPALRRFSIASRVAFAYIAGVVLLTIEGMLFTLAHIRWTPWKLGVPLALLSIALAFWWSAGNPAGEVRKKMAWSRLSAIALAITILALAGLCARVISGEAATVDYVWFWGVKAVRFAYVHGIDFEFLRHPLSIHAHPNYPPLVPVNMAWSILVSGAMPWMYAALVGCFWIVAAVPIVFDALRLRLDDEKAMLVTAAWTASIAASLVASHSAGGGEMQLVATMSIGVAALLVDPARAQTTLIVIVSFAAAVLCKLEGTFEVVAVLGGALLVSRVTKESLLRYLRIALAVFAPLALWWVFSLVFGVPLNDPIRERLLQISLANAGRLPLLMLRHLHAGAYGIPWLLTIVFLAANARRWREVLPAYALMAATLAFSVIYYLHVKIDPVLMVEWTLPRLTQPALSAALLAAGLVAFGHDRAAVERP